MKGKGNTLENTTFQAAFAFEKTGSAEKAVKKYEVILKKNPLHIDAAARLLILYRKSKQTAIEVKFLKKIINDHGAHIESSQREWIKSHKKLANDSKPLAKMLGLLNAKELPFYEHEVLQKWKKRLELLERSFSSAEKKKSKN